MIYFISDTHFFDERYDLLLRPFKNQIEYIDFVKNNWNNIVSPDDIVYCVGDMVYKNNKLYILNKLNGKKKLILGNHDIQSIEKYKKYFDSVHDKLYIKNKKDNKKFCLNHYPSQGDKNYWNIVGHVHGAWRFQKNMINVSVDCWNYTPVSLQQIYFLIDAIKNHYDEDIWAAYNKINTTHMDRGKKGSYSDK